MIRLIALLVAAIFSVSPVAAMTRAGAPAKFSIPFANSAGSSFITYPLPTPSQIGITNCTASLTDGFPPKTMQAAAAGGCAPFGQDINGILKQITQWNQQSQAGAVPKYDSAFSASIGGYPIGSLLSNASTSTCYWISTVDNNASDPDTGGADWVAFCPTTLNGVVGSFTTGPGITTSAANVLLGTNIIPGGRLTNVSATPVISSTTCANSSCLGTILYFAPYGAGGSPFIPIYDGTSTKLFSFSSAGDQVGLSLALDNNAGHTNYHAANSCFDVFYANVSGVLYFGTGPAWTVCDGSLGTPSRSAAISLYNGVMSNAAIMTIRYSNGVGSTVSVPAHQASFLGSIWTSRTTAGQVDIILGTKASGGGETLYGFWNYFNRIDSGAVIQDNSANSYNIDPTATGGNWVDCDHSPTTRVSWISGLAEESMKIVVNNEIVQNGTSVFTNYFFGLFLDADAGHTDAGAVPSTDTHPNFYDVIATTLFATSATGLVDSEFPNLTGAHYAQCTAAVDNAPTIGSVILQGQNANKHFPIFAMTSRWRY